MKFGPAGNPLILNQTEIKNRALSIRSRIDDLNDCYRELQQICTHPNKTSEYIIAKSAWSAGDDDWINHHCPDCDKRWTEDQ